MQSIALADGLLAIGEAMAGNPELEAQSINDWLTWLDQEGYDPKGLMEALVNLGQHCLAADDWQQLQTTARQEASLPDGIPRSVEHLEQAHPQLLKEIQAIAQARHQELDSLNGMAGGMKKTPAGALISMGAGLFVGGLYYAYLSKKTDKAIREMQQAMEDARRVNTDILTIEPHLQNLSQATAALEQDDDTKAANRVALDFLDKRINEQVAERYREGQLLVDQPGFVNLRNLELQTLETAMKQTTLRFPIPLSEMNAKQIEMTAFGLNTRYNLHRFAEQSQIGRDIEAKVYKAKSPDEYLREFNKWFALRAENRLIDEELEHQESRLLGTAENDEQKWERIVDIDNKLRREFEASEYMTKIIKVANGAQNFWGSFNDRIQAEVSKLQTRLREAKANGTYADTEEELDNYYRIDLSEGVVRAMLASHGDQPYADYMAPFAARYAGLQEEFQRLDEVTHPVLNRFKTLNSRARKVYADNRRFFEADEAFKNLDREELQSLINASMPTLKSCLEDPQALGEFSAKKFLGDKRGEAFIEWTYKKERAEVAQKVEAAVGEAKDAYQDELDNLDDVVTWYEKRIMGKAVHAFQDYLQANASRFERLLNNLEDAIKTEEARLKAAARDAIDV